MRLKSAPFILYRWGLGPVAQKKKVLIKEGKLDKYGRKNDKTPPDYLQMTSENPSATATVEKVVKEAAVDKV